VLNNKNKASLTRIFMGALESLRSDAYTNPDSDSGEFKEYVNSQLEPPFRIMCRTMRKIVRHVDIDQVLVGMYHNSSILRRIPFVKTK
jgi:hypothetical protein